MPSKKNQKSYLRRLDVVIGLHLMHFEGPRYAGANLVPRYRPPDWYYAGINERKWAHMPNFTVKDSDFAKVLARHVRDISAKDMMKSKAILCEMILKKHGIELPKED